MNDCEKFHFRWNNFESSISESFATLRAEEDFFDVTLVSEDLVQLSAHKVVLSSCSPVFKQLIKSSTHPHPVLFLRGVGIRSLEYILDFIYSGQVDIFQDHLKDFLDFAQDLKIKGVSSENEDNEKVFCVQNTITSEDQIIPVQTIEEVSRPIENHATNYSVDFNTDFEETDFESTINGMMEKVGSMWHCKVCGKEYPTKSKTSLKTHVESNHTSGFTHTCTICQKKCTTKTTLRFHNYKYHKMAYNI